MTSDDDIDSRLRLAIERLERKDRQRPKPFRVWLHDRRRGHQVHAFPHAMPWGIDRTDYYCHGCDWTVAT